MSDNFSLIIKNGSCYIDGKLTKTDIGLSGNKIKKIGKIELNSSKVYDATDKVAVMVTVLEESSSMAAALLDNVTVGALSLSIIVIVTF